MSPSFPKVESAKPVFISIHNAIHLWAGCGASLGLAFLNAKLIVSEDLLGMHYKASEIQKDFENGVFWRVPQVHSVSISELGIEHLVWLSCAKEVAEGWGLTPWPCHTTRLPLCINVDVCVLFLKTFQTNELGIKWGLKFLLLNPALGLVLADVYRYVSWSESYLLLSCCCSCCPPAQGH